MSVSDPDPDGLPGRVAAAVADGRVVLLDVTCRPGEEDVLLRVCSEYDAVMAKRYVYTETGRYGGGTGADQGRAAMRCFTRFDDRLSPGAASCA